MWLTGLELAGQGFRELPELVRTAKLLASLFRSR